MLSTILIMAGGAGERFWPLSTRERPKQLLKLIDENRSLIQMTVERVLPMVPAERIFIATNAVQAPAIREDLPFLPQQNIILEPAFKDTAAAIGFASIVIESICPGSVMAVLASDHLIKNEESFRETLTQAIEIAERDNAIVTLGVRPSYPETGYGYLETKEMEVGKPVKVLRFCEKPAPDLALEYFKGGRHLWNSGMFIFKVSVMMDAFRRLMPNHAAAFDKIAALGEGMRDAQNHDLINIFNTFQKISIDFGVMERFENTVVIPVDFGWSDIGSFPALADVFPGNENGTVVKGAEVNDISSTNNIVISTTGKKISLLGVDDMVIVETPDNILICSKKEAQNIKKLL
jgi:mannose-1-phosphate guanylyltransferase